MGYAFWGVCALNSTPSEVAIKTLNEAFFSRRTQTKKEFSTRFDEFRLKE